mmetsp:Transcript_22735/g.76360  ORF Transcript_22735/g.76360 Transcript_22735/m.76360 type:complete len:204 (+) Transcript_22735:2304-2915(+)
MLSFCCTCLTVRGGDGGARCESESRVPVPGVRAGEASGGVALALVSNSPRGFGLLKRGAAGGGGGEGSRGGLGSSRPFSGFGASVAISASSRAAKCACLGPRLCLLLLRRPPAAQHKSASASRAPARSQCHKRSLSSIVGDPAGLSWPKPAGGPVPWPPPSRRLLLGGGGATDRPGGANGARWSDAKSSERQRAAAGGSTVTL